MAITVYGTPQSNTDSVATDSSIAINLPNGGTLLSAPALMVISAGVRGGTPTFSTPAGYTLLTSVNDGSSDALYLFYQSYAAGATPPASVTVTAGGTWTYAGVMSIGYQGYNTVTPIDGAGVPSSTGAGSPFSATGITTTGANERVGWAAHVRGTVSNGGALANSLGTQEITAIVAGDASMEIVDLTQASAGASGANSITWAGAAVNAMAIAFAINPAPAGSGGNSAWLSTKLNNGLRNSWY